MRVKLPRYVHGYEDRHGVWRYYLCRKGQKKIPLPGQPFSTAFMDAYAEALRGTTKPLDIGAELTIEGTLSAAIASYYAHTSFKDRLAKGTQKMRRAILERMRRQHGEKHIATLPRDFIVRTINTKKPAAQYNWLKTLRGFFAFTVGANLRKDDPTHGIRLGPLKTNGIHTWTEEEIEQFEHAHAIGTRIRLAFDLLLYTAQRRSDVVVMGPQHVRGSAISVRQAKTGAMLRIPIHANLLHSLKATTTGHLAFLVTENGKPFSPASFGNWFRKACKEAGLPKHCSAHGLRKAACRRLAEAGCTTHQIAAISGHTTLGEVQRYTKAAEQAHLAEQAMATVARVANPKNRVAKRRS